MELNKKKIDSLFYIFIASHLILELEQYIQQLIGVKNDEFV